MRDNKRDFLFFQVYRNTHLRNSVFDHLGRTRHGFNAFDKQGKFYYSYTDAPILDFMACKHQSLIELKLNRFKELFSSSSTDQYDESLYNHWLDIKHAHRPNPFTPEDKLRQQQEVKKMNHDYLDQYMEFIAPYCASDRFITADFIGKYGLTKKRFETIEKYHPNLHYYLEAGILRLEDGKEILDVLAREKRASFVPEGCFHDPFFEKYKDQLRLLDEWHDHEFFYEISSHADGHPEKALSYFKWLIKVSPHYNYDLYAPPSSGRPLLYSQLYGVNVVYSDKKRYEFDHFVFMCPEFLKFVIKAWPESLVDNYTIKTINDVKVAQTYLAFLQEQPNIDLPNMRISTTSSNPALLALFESVGIVDYDLKKIALGRASTPADFNLCSIKAATKDPLSYVMDLFKDPERGFLATEAYGDKYILRYAIKKKRIDFIEFYRDRIEFLDTDHLLQAYHYESMEAFEMFFANYREDFNDETLLNLTAMAIRKHDFQHTVRFFGCIEQRSESYLVDCIFWSYAFLAHADSHHRQDAIAIVRHLKSQMQQQHLDLFLEQCDSDDRRFVFLLIFIVDLDFYRLLQMPFSDLDHLSLLTKVPVSLLDHLIDRLDDQELEDLIFRLEELVVAINISPNNYGNLKTTIYLFSKFQSKIKHASILEKLCHLAMYYDNHLLVDILLHQTRVRLQIPHSHDNDYEIMTNNYQTMVQSIHATQSTYFQTHTAVANSFKDFKFKDRKQFQITMDFPVIERESTANYHPDEPLTQIPYDEVFLNYFL
ncbi:hypothetical protein CYY_008589 [Polysphondylium violaceum]|uniref:Uncharacterized protein n=1 Tax=Polysphondylium violaceum TaxID=133409 RepID=A0A8J4V3S2_9MYCE|nr:hypothetical protein CYY_008589 [Polysphondylium violaceum]